jgi:putative transposase
MKLFRKNMRLAEYDYSTPGAYFITACTKNRDFFFNTLEAKLAVDTAWSSLLEIFANIELGEFVVMPNHIHGIIWITGEGSYRLHPGTWKNDAICRLGQLSDPATITNFVTLSNIIGAFKTTAATRVNKLRKTIGLPIWQKSFYDRIVRDEHELEQIQKYIRHNPIKWAEDRDNPVNPKFASSTKFSDDYWNEAFDIHT